MNAVELMNSSVVGGLEDVLGQAACHHSALPFIVFSVGLECSEECHL